MALSTFWNHSGELHQLEGFTQSIKHWEPGEPLEDIQQVLLQQLENIFGKEVVLEVEYSDGHQAIVRMPTATSNSDGDIVQDLSWFTREVALLQWLEANEVAIPVPRVLATVHGSESEPYTFSVIEKMSGDCILNVFGALSFDIKESIIRNMANFMLRLNSVDVPQQIGSTAVRGNALDLVPLVPISLTITYPRVFDTLEEYMLYLVQLKRESDSVGSDDDCLTRANGVLDRLLEMLPALLQRLSSTVYRRCVLNHDDLNEANVLVNSDGDITGVIDWEYQSVRPVVLAAQYPCYLRYDGIYHDPRFASVIKAQNKDYWHALVDGELLRQVEEWLTDRNPDPGCAALGRWMDEAFASQPPVEVKV
ncbi:hypothetical protein GSI_12482 [Ganoderma sinense ZZ0214-1]|uniref:Aminoglycoside phosphotransferase domain-containing protein n=1 Tax=Ganoderma sinense ZZ0214-1 TaxID=1077348 RepID=A0A2G8RTB8_9APHY|nr:hypothetical protein GSI_12482 [Ganoderma sinense ZZ0214-1]